MVIILNLLIKARTRMMIVDVKILKKRLYQLDLPIILLIYTYNYINNTLIPVYRWKINILYYMTINLLLS